MYTITIKLNLIQNSSAVEQRAVNALVVGSNPSSGDENFITIIVMYSRFTWLAI